MRVFGIAGWSGSGKTTLIARLVPALLRRGVSVSTLKHAHHGFDIDQPGKDSYRHREGGASEVMVASDQRWALMHELRGEAAPPLTELFGRMSPVDLILIEGYKSEPHPKLEVYRASLGKPLLAAQDHAVVAVASDAPVSGLALPFFALDNVEAIASFIIAHCGIEARAYDSARR